MKLKDQVAIVTGAGRNIGEEIAKLFAAEGASVAVVDIDEPRGGRVVTAIKAAGGEAELFIADVSRGSDVAAIFSSITSPSQTISTSSRSPRRNGIGCWR